MQPETRTGIFEASAMPVFNFSASTVSTSNTQMYFFPGLQTLPPLYGEKGSSEGQTVSA